MGHLHPALWRVVGQFKYRRLPQLSGNKEITAATNGSVKHHQGGSSAVIDDGQGGRIVCVNPVDGNFEDMDSFWAELVGILAALVVLDVLIQLEQTDRSTMKVDLWINSQASITVIGNRSTSLPWSNKVALGKEFLLLNNIHI